MIPPAYLLATKLEAFQGRGRGDFLGSRDLADIVALIDGRAELVGEVAVARAELREYVSAELRHWLRLLRLRLGSRQASSPIRQAKIERTSLCFPEYMN